MTPEDFREEKSLNVLFWGMFLVAILLLCLRPAEGQTYQPYQNPKIQLFDNNGAAAAGYKLCSFAAGTTTPLATYADNIGTANTNPVVLDGSGRATIYLGASAYKFILYDNSGNSSCPNSGVQIWSQDSIYDVGQLLSPVITNPGAGVSQTITQQPSTSFMVSGSSNFQNLNSIRFADQFSGADCGAKINAAEANLGTTAGEIWVNQACGTAWTTPVVISNTSHAVRFIQGGTYNCAPGASNSCITLSGPNTAIIGTSPAGSSGGGVNAATILKAANSAGITTAVVMLTGSNTAVKGMIVDGNQSGGGTSSGGNAIEINGANRSQIIESAGQNASGHGLYVFSSGTTNASCCGRVLNNQFIGNQKDGVMSQGTADFFFGTNEVENNLINGIELSNSGSWRINHSDIGGNGSAGGTCGGIAEVAGLCVYGTAAGTKSNTQMVSMTQFGQQYQHDILVVGYDTVGGATTSAGNIFGANTFIGSTNVTDNTYASVKMVDGGENVFAGNFFGSTASVHRFTNAIAWSETSSGRMLAGGRNGSNVNNGNFSGAIYTDTTTSGASNAQITVNNGAAGSAFDWFDTASGDSTPHKYWTIQSGTLVLKNNAYSEILNITDAGAATFDTSLKVGASGSVISDSRNLAQLRAQLTTTAATSDNVAITGATSASVCSLTATNASAATNIATTYISAKTTNQITVTHTATASMTYDILCTVN